MPTTSLCVRVDGLMVPITVMQNILKGSEQPPVRRRLPSRSWRKLLKLWALTQQVWVKRSMAKRLSQRPVPALVESVMPTVWALKQLRTSHHGRTQSHPSWSPSLLCFALFSRVAMAHVLLRADRRSRSGRALCRPFARLRKKKYI